MFTVGIVNPGSFFSPVGDTPAVPLTQCLPPEDEAAVLLLGCGDVRNILFTSYLDDRPLDITCCDIEKAIIARNILLLSLIVDDEEGARVGSHWNIYYHFRVSEPDLELLRSQARKLLSLSTSLEAWHASEYGAWLRLCDAGSLGNVREMWALYAAERDADKQRLFEKEFNKKMRLIRDHRARHFSPGQKLAAVRSAFPVHSFAVGASDRYWKRGTTDTDPSALSAAVHANPLFATPEPNSLLHYGTDPVLGFHLAPAFLPVEGRRRGVVETARAEFSQWVSSLRGRPRGSVTLRFMVGDALAFAYSLQHKSNPEACAGDAVRWYRDNFHFEPFFLDSEDYAPGGGAPVTFNVIDTFKLIDHLGGLNLLTALSPLLRDDAAATLYTEKLVKMEDPHEDLGSNLVGGPLLGVTVLLGLTPVEFVVNASPLSSGDEVLFNVATGCSGRDGSRISTRISWKRPLRSGGDTAAEPISFKPEGLAQVVFHVFQKMFEVEDLTQPMEPLKTKSLWKFGHQTYQRAGFVAFVRFVKSRVRVDWPFFIATLLALIMDDTSLKLTPNYLQEMFLWMHLLGVGSVDLLSKTLNPDGRDSSSNNNKSISSISNNKSSSTSTSTSTSNNSSTSTFGDLRDWPNMPSHLCITLVVPRGKVAFLGKDPTLYGDLPMQCSVQSPADDSEQWHHLFAAIQLGFGKLVTRGSRNTGEFRVEITDDPARWAGSSPLLVSFYTSSRMLLQDPRTARVAFGVQSTAHSSVLVRDQLGPGQIFRTTLDDADHVYITSELPNQQEHRPLRVGDIRSGIDALTGGASPTDTLVAAIVDPESGSIKGLESRLPLVDRRSRAILRSKENHPVRITGRTPFNVAASVAGGKLKLAWDFPAPVEPSRVKTHISRKSSYIIAVARVAAGLSIFATFLHPTALRTSSARAPVAWNLPYVNLPLQPVIDVASEEEDERLESWLWVHTNLAFSARERGLRDDQLMSVPAEPEERTRMKFKLTLTSIAMRFAGMQTDKPCRVFGVSCKAGLGIGLYIFVSALRLDLASRSVVLDAAVLPLRHDLTPRIKPFLDAVSDDHAGLVTVLDVGAVELRLWKAVLPAWAERCRGGLWRHGRWCEYATARRVPLSTEPGARVLCSCGEGALGDGDFFRGDSASVPAWEAVAPHAVRVAITLPFPSAMSEQEIEPCQADDDSDGGGGGSCRVCRRTEARAGKDGAELLRCGACRRARYCSPNCQRRDWKKHKAVCSK